MILRKSTTGFLFVRLEVSLIDLPSLLSKHRREYPGADDVENAGRALISSGFHNAQSQKFVEHVCRWGGGERNLGRVLSQNTAKQLSGALREGYEIAKKGNVALGVERIRRIHGLGQSFASKQLRFLLPTKAVVLDSVVRGGLGYAETVAGYNAYLSDCETILASARECPALDDCFLANLRVCDIEAAIFAKLQDF